MVRFIGVLIAGLVLAWSALAPAADAPGPLPEGNWKLTVLNGAQAQTLWILKFEQKDGKWTGTVVASANLAEGERLKSTLEDLRVDKEQITFNLQDAGLTVSFEGQLPKEKGGKVLGSVILTSGGAPAQLEPTMLTSLEPIELAREVVAKSTNGPEIISAAMTLLEEAADKKAKPEEVRSWAGKAAKNAETFGPRYHRHVILDIAETLNKQEGFAQTALQYAYQAERLIDEAKDPAYIKKRILATLATALEKNGKADDAKEVRTRNDKIPWVAVKKFPGRKGKSDRAVLVELFACTHLRDVAGELAFDALGQTYKPSEVVLVQYQLHEPSRGVPNPLTTPENEARIEMYAKQLRQLPSIILNGKLGPTSRGPYGDAPDRYAKYCEAIAPLLEQPAKAAIKLTAVQKGTKIDIKAEVSDVQEPSEKNRLHLILVEDRAVYPSLSKLPAHLSVARAYPGGATGIVVKEKAATQTVSVDLDDVRKKLKASQDRIEKDVPFPDKERPMEFKKLRIVAFVQNDEKGEVLQAAQTEVKAE
jgi:hypothetical protein